MYLLEAAWFPHGERADVHVCPGTVPIPGDGLRVKRGDDAKVLRNTVKQVSADPYLIAQ